MQGARFLFHARKLGVDFGRTATIGRQGLYLTPKDFEALAQTFGETIDADEAQCIFSRSAGYAEELIKFLGAGEVESFDFSAYEGATHLHDLNKPIPARFRNRYSAVIDGGSLEHVFNFPQAIRNCMEMVRVGGHYLGITPANNFFGHGFYQFSPELYFSVLTERNGFELTSMVAFEDRPDAHWYAVRSPMEVAGRVTLNNSAPVYLLVLARRAAQKAIFETMPQQSDYAVIWRAQSAVQAKAQGQDARNSAARISLPRRLARMFIPARIRWWVRSWQVRPRPGRPGFDPRFFRRFDPAADAKAR